jgi:hypothetical protein
MVVLSYDGETFDLAGRGRVHVVAEWVPGRTGMRPEWVDLLDGFDETLRIDNPDGDFMEVRLTPDEAFRLTIALLRDVSMTKYGSG